jgi:hypothetical protein
MRVSFSPAPTEPVTTKREVWSWYSYGFASEAYVVVRALSRNEETRILPTDNCYQPKTDTPARIRIYRSRLPALYPSHWRRLQQSKDIFSEQTNPALLDQMQHTQRLWWPLLSDLGA